MPTTSSTICIRSRYWRTNARQRGSVFASANLFGPYCSRRAVASAVVRPAWTSTPSCLATSSPESANQAVVGWSVAVAVVVMA